MRLGTKLAIMSFFTILIPMLIIVFFSVFMIYQSNAITQWEYLEDIRQNIIDEITKTEEQYTGTIKTIANETLVRDKLYVYEKYWDMLSERLRAYDAQSLLCFIGNTARDNNIERIAVYRRSGSQFIPVAVQGSGKYLPEVLYKEIVQADYSKAIYRSYPDGIYLDMVYPVFSDGKLVGLVQFMRGFNEEYLHKYSNVYGIDYALFSVDDIIFNSKPVTDDSLMKSVQGIAADARFSFRAGRGRYSGIVSPFNLGGSAVGTLVLYSERLNIFKEDSFIMQRLLAVTLLCIIIPVFTFSIKEIRLIQSINSLLSATYDISAGNYNSRVSVSSNDELGMLTNNFNQMVDVLKKNRKELESRNEELALKNSYIDAVFQSLRINIIVIDPESRIRVVNKNAGSRLELTEEHYGRQILDVEPFRSIAVRLNDTLAEILESRKFTRLYSVKLENTSYEMDFYPVLEDDGNLSAIVIILNNITEKMNMERALIRSDRLASVGKLAAGLAHEINNPMSVILNHVQLLQSDNLNHEEKNRFLGRAETEIKRVNRLVRNLLKFSREDKPNPENIALGDFMNEVLGLFDPQTESRAVENFYDGGKIRASEAEFYNLNFKDRHFNFYVTRKLNDSFLICERDSLKQIMFNLIKNAFESCMRKDGIIWVDWEKEQGGIFISLYDNGCGMDEEELVNAFELFYTNGKSGSGVGLGLPLCRRLMNSFGGDITIESEKEQGTIVRLFFPEREDFYG